MKTLERPAAGLFYLIEKDGEFRLTNRISTLRMGNHIRHGWDPVKMWRQRPTAAVIKDVGLRYQMGYRGSAL